MKRTSLRRRPVPTVLLALLLVGVWCAESLAVGEAGAQFLKIGVGAKAQAIGSAFVALADDASAVYWNPAGLARQQGPSIQATYGLWFEDMGHHSFAAVVPVGHGRWGAAVCYSPSGDIPHVDADLQELGDYDAYDLSGSLAYADVLGDALAYGLGVKVIQSKIEEESATGFAADLGAIYDVPRVDGFSLGLALQNMGPELKFIEHGDPLPFLVRGGAAFRLGQFTLTGDVSRPRDNDASVHVGGQFFVGSFLALRAGFLTRPEMESAVTFGLGVTWKRLSLDYAYVPFEEIETTHLVSAGLSF